MLDRVLLLLLSLLTMGSFHGGTYVMWLIILVAFDMMHYKDRKRFIAAGSLLQAISIALSPAAGIAAWILDWFWMKPKTFKTRTVSTRKGGVYAVNRQKRNIDYYDDKIKVVKKGYDLIDIPLLEGLCRTEIEYCCESSASNDTVFEYEALSNEDINERLLKATKEACYRDWYFVVVGIMMFAHVLGFAHWSFMVFVPIMSVVATRKVDTVKDSYYDSKDFKGKNGLYRVFKVGVFKRNLIGVAYAEDGTLYSKKHVCDGPVFYDGIDYQVSYISERDDMIAWGGRPRIEALNIGDSVVVEILPTNSLPTITFTSIVVGFGRKIAFKSLPTRQGVSGSPMFKVITSEEGSSLKFAGCYGNSVNGDFVDEHKRPYQIEIAENSGQVNAKHEDMAIVPGSYYQIFMHPGSGKTRTLIPEICKQGGPLVDKILVLTPTVVVANEFVASTDLEVGTLFKGGLRPDKSAKIQVMAHATALCLMVNHKFPFKHKRLGFIVDESHVHNTKTMCLLEAIKHRISDDGKGFCVELSATGEKAKTKEVVLERGSNYPIEERGFSLKNETIERLTETIANNNPGKKVVVFLGNVQGANESVNSLRAYLRGRVDHTVVLVHRNTFSTGYPLAKEDRPNGSIILTTSVSECGANYNADIVIDSMAQLRYESDKAGTHVRVKMGIISEAQYVQRRGRVGRRKEGIYYYPIERRMAMHEGLGRKGTAEEFDMEVFCRSMGISKSEGFRLTEEQVSAWLGSVSETYDGPMNPRTVELLYTRTGVPYTKNEVAYRLKRKLLDGQIPVRFGGQILHLQYWDERDRKHLERLLYIYTMANPEVEPEPRTTISRVYSKRLRTLINGNNPIATLNGIPIDMIAEVSDSISVSRGFFGTTYEANENESSPLDTN